MPGMNIDFDEETDKILRLYSAQHNCNKKQAAIEIIKKYKNTK